MKKIVLVLLFYFTQLSFSQSIVGKWTTIDDETGVEKSVVEIYESGGDFYGKIIEIKEVEHRNKKCTNCNGTDKDKPILGLIIIKKLSKDNDVYSGGTITDPKNGKEYRCKIILDGNDKLIVRGYIGISLFGRSQTWKRKK
ncbi:MAG TPA: DUF2147 domain-containing protein [Flavobacterium sp.]|jgi:uncharacterized protein (DUF2147 family)|uniref:DUF2147 domain-containing protein n=1 Tax=Flavobacterium sp. TaxID=239 RepID=UPI002B5DB405|nr:DUF2147 domain-containing protein [Flavobacterium sp.]MCA0350046.1 DUF2147 domain-containing protein [Bacteroidota bacterium]HPW97702.1 DUF2147 domain-containing protein [Flavobacterium sp.]HQA74567.1 DUF2147 domain-containing protein [Flavobacterium sp.]